MATLTPTCPISPAKGQVECPQKADPPSATPPGSDQDLADILRARLAADDGARHDLDDVIAWFGFTREDLEADEDPTK